MKVEDRRRIIPFSVSHPEDPDVVAVRVHLGARPRRRAAAAAPRRARSGGAERGGGRARPRRLRHRGIRATGADHRRRDRARLAQRRHRARRRRGHAAVPQRAGLLRAGVALVHRDRRRVRRRPAGRTGTIVIPIDVRPTENQPPAFTGGVIDFEPGQSKTIDLVKLTNYPYPDAIDELAYQVLPPGPTASPSPRRPGAHDRGRGIDANGTGPAVTIGVADAAGDGRPGRIDLRVVPSTRPIAQPAADTRRRRARPHDDDRRARERRGRPTRSRATPLRVVGVRGLDDSLPAGVSIEPSADRSTLAVTSPRARRRSTRPCSTRWPMRPTTPAGMPGAP